MTAIASMPMIPFKARLVWLAREPAKSSVDIWSAGIKASSMRYCVH